MFFEDFYAGDLFIGTIWEACQLTGTDQSASCHSEWIYVQEKQEVHLLGLLARHNYPRVA